LKAEEKAVLAMLEKRLSSTLGGKLEDSLAQARKARRRPIRRETA
jgi:hypothetical protein